MKNKNLCDDCSSFAYKHGQAPQIFPWVHCHHSMEVKKEKEPVRPCAACIEGAYHPLYRPGIWEGKETLVSDFCPKCGRNLKPEGGKP